jgi:hypothetical protein
LHWARRCATFDRYPNGEQPQGFPPCFSFFQSQQSSEAKRHILHHTALFSVLGQAFVIFLGHLSPPPTVSPQPRARSFWILTSVSLTTRLVPGRAFWAHQHTTGQGLFRITGGLRFDFFGTFLCFPRISFSSKIRGTAAMHEARLCPRQNILWILDSHAYYFQPSFFCYFDSS